VDSWQLTEVWRCGIGEPRGAVLSHGWGAGLLSSLIETEGLVELPESATLVEPGTMVAFLPYLVLL
jgi:molybdopterin biosynthesis enzyme